jgi:hypothetical protein
MIIVMIIIVVVANTVLWDKAAMVMMCWNIVAMRFSDCSDGGKTEYTDG